MRTLFILRNVKICSANNCTNITDIISARLSPCSTPQLYLALISSLPIFNDALKLPYSFSTYFACLSSAPIFLRAIDTTSCLILSCYFARSINATCDSMPCSILDCNNAVSANAALVHPILDVALNCTCCPFALTIFLLLRLTLRSLH